MKGFRARAVGSMLIVTLAVIVGLQVYDAVFINRDPGALLANLPRVLAVSSLLLALASILLLRILKPLADTAAAAGRGERPSEEARAAAFDVQPKANRLVVGVLVAAFAVGPVLILLAAAAKGSSFSAVLVAKILATNLACGFMAAIQIVVLMEEALRPSIVRLDLVRVPASSRKASLRGWVLLAAAAGSLVMAVLLGVGGLSAIESAAAVALTPLAFILKAGLLALALAAWSASLFLSIGGVVGRQALVLEDRLGEILRGGGDLTMRVPVIRNDEIGRLSGRLNHFLDVVEASLLKVRELSGKVQSGANSLAESAEHAGGSVGALESSVATMRDAAERQAESLRAAEGEIERMVVSIDRVADRVADQASAVEQSSAAVSEMVANIASVSRVSAQADGIAGALRTASADGGEALKASLAAIREIEEASRSVKEIIGVISKIAAQTNLLAMNAAIEAAHAGEAGRGFAVVADEVRGLAESASRSAKEIVGLIQGMNQKIERGAALADRAGQAFGRITEGVEETGELVRTIASSMSEQQGGAEEILKSANALTDATQGIKALTMEQKEESKEMAAAMQRVVAASGDIVEAAQEGAGSTQSLGRVVGLVGEEAARNRALVAGLEEAVGKFRFGSR